MSGHISRIILSNFVYFTLFCIVYMRNIVLFIFCLVFIGFTIYTESKIFVNEIVNSDLIIDALQYLNQQLRVGDSPGFAYRKMLEMCDRTSLEFKNEFNQMSPYAWMVFDQLKSEMDFNYETFENQLGVIMSEMASRKLINGILDKSRMQINIMKHLPLIIEMLFLHNQTVDTFIYSCSICLLMISNALTYNYFREILW